MATLTTDELMALPESTSTFKGGFLPEGIEVPPEYATKEEPTRTFKGAIS